MHRIPGAETSWIGALLLNEVVLRTYCQSEVPLSLGKMSIEC